MLKKMTCHQNSQKVVDVGFEFGKFNDSDHF